MRRAFWLLLFLASVLPREGLADGCYLPVQAVRKIPEITGQRALIVWKDGVETMVVASALDSESQRLGWIIPVPAVPEAIEKESPGVLRTLSYVVQPRITHDLMQEVGRTFLVVVVANLLLAVALFRRGQLLGCLLLLVLWGILSAALFPAFIAAGSEASVRPVGGAHLEMSARVGAYEVSVVRAGAIDDLNAWLGTNGLARLPVAAAKPVAEYVRDGWVFAVIRLCRDEVGANTPHPVRLSFRAAAPVYPMKVTALAGGTPSFELFVLADRRMRCQSLSEEYCDQFVAGKGKRRLYADGDADVFRGVNTGIEVAHPVLMQQMWNGCVLTKFSGRLSRQDMSADLHFQPTTFAAHRRHLYTGFGAWCMAAMVWLLLMGGGLFFVMIRYGNRILAAGGGRWFWTCVFLPLLGSASLAAALTFVFLPKLAPGAYVQRMWHGRVGQDVSQVIAGTMQDWGAIDPEKQDAICQAVLAAATSHRRAMLGDAATNTTKGYNRALGEDLRVEDSPGNFTIGQDRTNLIFRVYEHGGHPVELRYPLGGAPSGR